VDSERHVLLDGRCGCGQLVQRACSRRAAGRSGPLKVRDQHQDGRHWLCLRPGGNLPGRDAGRNLTADKARYARQAAEQFLDKAALFGDTSTGFLGLFNNPAVLTAPAAATGTGSATQWTNKTPDQILLDVNNLLSGIWITSQTIEMADTLLMPLAAYTYITTTRLSNLTDMTILEWMMKANAFTSETGRQLTGPRHPWSRHRWFRRHGAFGVLLARPGRGEDASPDAFPLPSGAVPHPSALLGNPGHLPLRRR
jgi:hypothetical protein